MKRNDKKQNKNIEEYVGKEFINNQGLKFKIIHYEKYNKVTILFEDGYKKVSAIKEINKGRVSSPFFKGVFGVGYIGESEHRVDKHIYTKWRGMLERCYGKNANTKSPSYKDCCVCDEWLNYSNFARWYKENLWCEDFDYIDKDIVSKNNKIYCPENCVMVDNRLNCLFTKTNKNRGRFPIGVYYKKKNKQFVAQCSVVYKYGKIQKHLGLYSTPEEAFSMYKKFKESYIKQIADEYKNKYENFPKKLYDAMYLWEVELDD